jgi:ATPase subunit of ABC transporter with duplicated ATPase domains
LNYHVGNYSEYQRQQNEKASREAQILDAAERQRSKAQAFLQKQAAAAHKKGADPNKQRQAKMIKEKKMDRIGNYREDGKRYKMRSLKKLDEKSVRLAQKVQIEVDEPVIKMYFPNPTWPPAIAAHDTIVRMENVSFGYDKDNTILHNVTLNLDRGSKVALVGKNGSGKSTLVKLIAGEHNNADGDVATTIVSGDLWVHPNLRIGHVSQYSVEELEAYSDQTVVEYAQEKLRSGRASADIVAKASGNVRQYLGAFGLGGKHALRRIGQLSGGERMRLCFATALADEPHLFLLDESTNHVDIETLESMSMALNDYEGSVLMVSHNQAFLSGFCKELWVLDDDGHITVNHSDTESFDEIFFQYRSSILQSGKSSLSDRRRQKAGLAKRAIKQQAGTRKATALL